MPMGHSLSVLRKEQRVNASVLLKSHQDYQPDHLVDLLRQRSIRQGRQRAFTFLSHEHERVVSYAELDQYARRIAAELQRCGYAGQRALLLFPPGLEYLASFFGCLYAGVAAVPIYPSNPGQLAQILPQLLAIIADAQVTVVLSTALTIGMSHELAQMAPELGALSWISIDSLPEGSEEDWRQPDVTAQDLAFLQYSPGMRRTLRSVLLSHANLLANSSEIAAAFGTTEDSVMVSWLPPYHDTGLISGLLQPLYRGCLGVMMEPMAFLQRPRRWLEAITYYGADLSGGPNFAYDLCVRRIAPAERAGLDLSSWRLAFNGAEPVHTQTLARFNEAFAPLGFQPKAHYMCYGLAEMPVQQLFQPPRSAELAALTGSVSTELTEPDLLDVSLPLTPIQHWFFAQSHPVPAHWNKAVLLEVRVRLVPALLANAVRELLARHAALRLRFTQTPEGWSQHCAGHKAVDQPLVHYYDLRGLDETAWRSEFKQTAAMLHTSLDLTAGPLLRVGYFDLGADRPGRLLLLAHHLVSDTVSWRILLEDLQVAYMQLRTARPVSLPEPTSSYAAWAQHLASAAVRAELADAVQGWLAELAAPPPSLPLDLADGPNEVAAECKLGVTLDTAQTALLEQSAAAAYGADLFEVLLTALALTLAEWTGAAVQQINLENHRPTTLPNQPDLSRTVGWFTSIYPVRLEPGSADAPGMALRLVREQLQHAREWGERYWLLRRLSPDPALRAQLAALPQAELVVNYMGHLETPANDAALFRPASEPVGPLYAPDSPRAHLIALGMAVVGGRLELRWSYSMHHHRRETIEWLARRMLGQLELLSVHCQTLAAARR
jgi:non-ribosomal peptide synthase protein (TIGR01720 family)